MKEKITEYRVHAGKTPDGDDFYRYFSAFTSEEALEFDRAAREKEGSEEEASLIEAHNPYSDEWISVPFRGRVEFSVSEEIGPFTRPSVEDDS